jgi:signal peptide peptidase SppA
MDFILDRNIGNRSCYDQHLGVWAVERSWLNIKLALMRAGDWEPLFARHIRDEDGEIGPIVTENGVAIINIIDGITKGDSSMGGTSTLATQRDIRSATRNPDVSGIMLFVDSPGGTVAGIDELSTDITNAGFVKPVHAFVDDLGASAALWLLAQAGAVSMNEMGRTGSIGVFAVVEDHSKQFDNEGIKVHVISSGELKGGATGAPVTDAEITEIQKRVDEINVKFIQSVAEGRLLTTGQVSQLADGRMFNSQEALANGLIDKVQSFEDAMADLVAEIYGDENDVGSRNARVAAMKIKMVKPQNTP